MKFNIFYFKCDGFFFFYLGNTYRVIGFKEDVGWRSRVVGFIIFIGRFGE